MITAGKKKPEAEDKTISIIIVIGIIVSGLISFCLLVHFCPNTYSDTTEEITMSDVAVWSDFW